MPTVAMAVAEPPNGHNIVEIVARHTQLEPIGGDDSQLRGTCPFCSSRAFKVRPQHSTFHCFGCGESGDGHRFLAKINTRDQSGNQ